MSALEDSIRDLVREVIRQEVSAGPTLPRPLLTADEVAALLGSDVDRQTVYRLARAGDLRPIYLSETRFKFQVEEVERFVREGGVKKTCLKDVSADKVRRHGGRQ